MEYLSLPFILRKGYLTKTDLYESISFSLGLILSSRPGSLPFEPEFGCELWEKEYSDLYTANRSDVQGSVRNAIGKFEKRLFNVSVTLLNVETGRGHTLGLAVRVTGSYRDGEFEKKFDETFNIG